MTEDEMKNRISFALKDPILQQGFEIICKENAELKTLKIPQLERKIASIRGAYSVDCKKLNAKIEQVERLKKQVSAMSKALVDVVSGSDEIKDRLSKAKEIIRSLYFIIQGRIDYKGNISLEDEMYRAKQFLQ